MARFFRPAGAAFGPTGFAPKRQYAKRRKANTRKVCYGGKAVKGSRPQGMPSAGKGGFAKRDGGLLNGGTFPEHPQRGRELLPTGPRRRTGVIAPGS